MIRFSLIGLVLLIALGDARAEKVEISFQSTYDGSEQLAFALVPDEIGMEPLPLLVLAHPFGGTRHAQDYYYSEVTKRGWLLVVPELHGVRNDGPFSFAAPQAQHDIIDAINHMRSEYPVDPSRIYLAGRSMGGMLASIVAAKYPGVFAAVVAGQGVYDLEAQTLRPTGITLREPVPPIVSLVDSLLYEELGGPFSPETEFDYRRRSVVTFARNLQYVPLILWHGTMDLLVLPEQTELLVAAARKHDRFFPEPNWLRGAPHMPMNFPPSWILDQLEHHRNIGWKYPGVTPGGTRSYAELDLVTDEPGQFFWLEIVPDDGDVFAEVQASLTGNALTVRTKDVDGVRVHMEAIPDWIQFATYDLETEDEATLTILRDGEVLFSQTGNGRGKLPELWPDEL